MREITNKELLSELLEKGIKLSRQALYLYEEKGLIKSRTIAGRVKLYPVSTIDRIVKIRELAKRLKLSAIKEELDKEKNV